MADPYAPYLQQAQALFVEGDVVKAGQIWQAILKRDPGHEAARAGLYKVKAFFDARATQDGLAAAAEPPKPLPPTRQTLTPATPEINSLLDAGCALYDAGLLEKAISTWEMALQTDPANALARGYIDGARRKLEEENPPAEAPPIASPEAEDRLDKLLRDGCTLFDMGQSEDALRKWEQILAQEPNHRLARAYSNDARKDLGLAPLDPGEIPVAPASPASPEGPVHHDGDDMSRADRLVREGVQIYDMGMTDEAMGKWHQALALEPGHRDAGGYLDMARRDKHQAPPTRPVHTAPPASPSTPTQAPVLGNLPDARVLPVETRLPSPVLREEAVQLAPPPAPLPVDPPKAILAKAPVRKGLKLPSSLGELRLPPWLATPRNLALALGLLVVLGLPLALYQSHQRDAALRDAVASAKTSAMAPIARRTQVVDLAESPGSIRAEGQHALEDNALIAYYRAQECLRLDPGDAVSAQLLERAKARMAEAPPQGASSDLEASMKNGDLEGARSAVWSQLSRNPEDPDLKAMARSILLALVESRTATEHFSEARDLLLQGRALFPQDKTWPAKLKLLEEIQGMGKADRARWLPLLG